MEITSEDYAKAADLIEERGHCKQKWEDHESGGLCVIGSIAKVKGLDYYNFVNTIDITINSGLTVRWNDEDDRTPKEVINRLRELADETRRKENYNVL